MVKFQVDFVCCVCALYVDLVTLFPMFKLSTPKRVDGNEVRGIQRLRLLSCHKHPIWCYQTTEDGVEPRELSCAQFCDECRFGGRGQRPQVLPYCNDY
jgi:hypothetical protein